MTQMTQRELLIRIDERQQNLYKVVQSIEKKVDKKVNVSDYLKTEEKIDILWDLKNKVVGMTIVIGAVAGAIAAVLKDFLYTFLQ